MYDVSGEGWVQHILYGTARILESRGPDAYTSGDARSFFLIFRVFETCRSLIYSEASFLSQDSWKSKSRNIWSSLPKKCSLKEDILDIMLECSQLNQR